MAYGLFEITIFHKLVHSKSLRDSFNKHTDIMNLLQHFDKFFFLVQRPIKVPLSAARMINITRLNIALPTNVVS